MTDLTEVLESPFLDADKFFKKVDQIRYDEYDSISYMESTIRACDFFMIDPEDVHKLRLVSPVLKDKLRSEAMDDGLLKREAQLPI